VPTTGPDGELELPTYMNRGTENHQVTMDSNEVSMCTVAPPGQSGFIAPDGKKSIHYDDQMQLYKDFECKTEHLTEAGVDANLESSMTLILDR
ncbi:MAG: penicillin acylase, partial [Motiliproteus sp.]